MRFLQVISHYVPAYAFGGPLRAAHGLGRALRRRGHEMVVCCTSQRTPADDLDVPNDTAVEIDGIQVYYGKTGRWGRRWGLSQDLHRRVMSEAEQADVVITHFHYQYASIVGGSAARRFGRPLYIFTHGSLSRYGMAARKGFLKRMYLALMESRNFKTAAGVVFHSAFEMDSSIRIGRPVLLPLGIDPDEFDLISERLKVRCGPNAQPGRFLFAYVGRLAEGKGLDLLLPAFAEIATGANPQLILIGADERGYEAKLRGLAAGLGIAERVTFAGLLVGPAKTAALAAADAFVLPSRSEGLSLATVEAMYAGLPVIVTDRVGMSATVARAKAGLVVSYSKEAIACGLSDMIVHPERRDMGRRGHEAVATEFTWERIADQFLQMVQRSPVNPPSVSVSRD